MQKKQNARKERYKTRAFRRKLLATSTALLVGLPHLCTALGLGEIEFKSHLGEPLSAQIDLVNLPADVSADNLKIRQLDRAEAEQLGVEIISSWHRLDFDVKPNKSNFQVELHTQRPINEPYLNILIELAWPKGTIYREYTMFLDPAPIIPESMAAKSRALGQQESQQAVQTLNREEHNNSKVQPQDHYRVAVGDTLYGIAKRLHSENDISENANWLFENNQQAFIDGDMNKLIAGIEIRLPTNALVGETLLAEVNTQAKGRVILEQPVKINGDQELAKLNASSQGSISEQLSTSRAILDFLVKENRDLKDRLSYLESSEYLSTMKQLVELQQQEIADLRSQLATSNSPALEASTKTEKALVAAIKPQVANASISGLASNLVVNEKQFSQFWTFLSSGIAAAAVFLLALFAWRTRNEKFPGATTKIAQENISSSSQEDYTASIDKDDHIEFSFDGVWNAPQRDDELVDLDLDLASANDDVQALSIDAGEADSNQTSTQTCAQTSTREEIEEKEKVVAENLINIRQISEKVQEEREKVHDLQQSIKEKTDQYIQRKNEGYKEPQQVEEIEIDPEMEQFLKL